MSETVQLPALGESVTEGTVTRWLKQVGDTVEVDEPLLEVSTDKVDTEIPSPFAGVLEQILVQEDETVEVGATLAVIGDGSGPPAPATPPAAEAARRRGSRRRGPAEPAGARAEQPAAEARPPRQPAAAAEQPAAAPAAAPAGGGDERHAPRAGRVRHRGHRHPLAQGRRRHVAVDEPLLEVSTDKVDTEIPSPVAGTLQEIRVQEDETVEVGAVLAVIGSGAAAPAAAAPAAEAPRQPAAPAEAPGAGTAAGSAAGSPRPTRRRRQRPAARPPRRRPHRQPRRRPAAPPRLGRPGAAPAGRPSGTYLTPLVRKLAAEKGVDIAVAHRHRRRRPHPQGGRPRRRPPRPRPSRAAAAAARPHRAAAPAAPPSPPLPPTVSPLRGTDREGQPRSARSSPSAWSRRCTSQAQLTTVVEVDVTTVAQLRAKAKDGFQAREGVNLTFLPFFVQAAVEALKAYPKINARRSRATQITYHGAENVGIAVDTERGLLVPVITRRRRPEPRRHRPQDRRPGGPHPRRTRSTPDELSRRHVHHHQHRLGRRAVRHPDRPRPQVGDPGHRRDRQAPGRRDQDADGDEIIAIRSMCYLSLSYDHRLVDGADAAASSPRSRTASRRARSRPRSVSDPHAPDRTTTARYPARGCRAVGVRPRRAERRGPTVG